MRSIIHIDLEWDYNKEQSVEIPAGAKLLSFHPREGELKLSLWFEVNSYDTAKVIKKYMIVLGNDIPIGFHFAMCFAKENHVIFLYQKWE